MKTYLLSLISLGFIFSQNISADDCLRFHDDILNLNSKSYALSKTLVLIDDEREEAHYRRLYELSSLNQDVEKNLSYCSRNQKEGMLRFEEYYFEAKDIYKEIDRNYIYEFSYDRVIYELAEIEEPLRKKFHSFLIGNVYYQEFYQERKEQLFELVTKAKKHIEVASPETHFAFLAQLDLTSELALDIKLSTEEYLSKLAAVNKEVLANVFSAEVKIVALNVALVAYGESLKVLKADRLKYQVLHIATLVTKISLQVQLEMAKTASQKKLLRDKIKDLNKDLSRYANKLIVLGLQIKKLEDSIAKTQSSINKLERLIYDEYMPKVLYSRI